MKRINIYIFYFFLIISIFTFSGCGNREAVNEENLVTYDIHIPGAEDDYTFLYLTDMHITLSDENDSEQIANYSKERLPTFTSQGIPASSELLPQWIDYTNTQNFDGLLLGGDIIDFPSHANIDCLQTSLEQLEVPYVYTLGNHDWTYPWEYMTENGKSKYLPLLSSYMDDNIPIHTEEYDDFTIVAVDNSSNQINPAALDKYKTILAKKKPVVLLLHVPLFTKSALAKASDTWKSSVILGGGIHGGIYPNPVSAEFISLTTAKGSPVEVILAGHTHFEEKSDVIGEKNIPQIIGNAGFKGKATIIRITG